MIRISLRLKVFILILLNLIKLNHSQIFASAHKNKRIKLWYENDSFIDLTGHTDEVIYLEILPNYQLASCSLDNTIRIWHVKSGSQLKILNKTYTNSVKSITLINETLMASQSTNSDIVLWNLNDFSVNKIINNEIQTNSLFIIKMLNSQPLLVSASKNSSLNLNSIKILNLLTSQIIREINFNIESNIKDFDIFPNDKIVFLTENNTVHVYDLISEKELISLNNKKNITKLKIFINGHIAMGFDNGNIKIWNGSNIQQFNAHGTQIMSIEQLNDEIFISGAMGGGIRKWNLTNSRVLSTFLSGIDNSVHHLVGITYINASNTNMSDLSDNLTMSVYLDSNKQISFEYDEIFFSPNTSIQIVESSSIPNSNTLLTTNPLKTESSTYYLNSTETNPFLNPITKSNQIMNSLFTINFIELKVALNLLEHYDMNDCLTNCSLNGYCKMNESNKFICECKQKYFIGSRCEIDLRKCSSDNICLNNGSCFYNLTTNSHKCICDEFYFGKNCENKIDICQNETCSNKGICQHVNKQTKCICYLGYYGLKCEYESTDRKLIRQTISTTVIIAIIIIFLLVFLIVLSDLSTYLCHHYSPKSNKKKYSKC